VRDAPGGLDREAKALGRGAGPVLEHGHAGMR
jgi:hypothetical protein